MAQSGIFSRYIILMILLLGLVVPIVAGLMQTVYAAFGIISVLGTGRIGLSAWRNLLELPGFWTSFHLTVWTGCTATLLSLFLAVSFCAVSHTQNTATRWLTPILAAPHAAIAIGLAFVLSPSGWIARLLAPIFGLDHAPDLATINDAWGNALIIGLIIKETPFLILIIWAALTEIPVRQNIAAGRMLGYRRAQVWIQIIMPQLWPLIRLPVLVVLAYSSSTVEMGIILGPSNPPVLAVFLMRLFTAPDLSMILPASAGAIVQLLLVVAVFAALLIVERLVCHIGLWWIRTGVRGRWTEPLLQTAGFMALIMFAVGAFALVSLTIWSLAWRWPWPSILPETWSLRLWGNTTAQTWMGALYNTLILAVASTTVSLIIAIAWLEAEDRSGRRRSDWVQILVYLPLILPQIAFLYGLNMLFLRFRIGGGIISVIWAHFLFVFPYVMIALTDPWRAFDPRLTRAAASLGAGSVRRLFTIKLPILIAPVMTAAAIGIAVSVAQYLPTLFMGAGRVSTLTTEAVTLSSGSDRRITGVYASLQMAFPFIAYMLAIFLPKLFFRHRVVSG